MAVCLLGGYAWFAVAGWAWTGSTLGLPLRDMALHALGLGFIVSMMLGHAPVILPAIARIKIEFGKFFYPPLVALHLSPIVRLVWGLMICTGAPRGAAGTRVPWRFCRHHAGERLLWRVRHACGQRRRINTTSTTPHSTPLQVPLKSAVFTPHQAVDLRLFAGHVVIRVGNPC